MNLQKIKDTKLRFGIIGNSPELNRAIDVALQVASTDLSVLITGESGVGKEHFPQIIHQNSARKHNKYIAVNCGAIPEGTIDSELFGHVKGAYTGAIDERRGYFGEADKGTIFLDEIGELPLSTQARLLRVLETGEYIRVGSSQVEKTNVRIVAATNVNLSDAIAAGRFREDLYYRLSTIPIKVPSLKERPSEDIELLFRKFALDVSDRYSIPAVHLTDSARQLLVSYPWPGNIRQLKNITEQISLLSEKRDITADVLREFLPPVPSTLPTMFGMDEDAKGKTFANEREMLYSVLFEMRKDIADLRAKLNAMTSGTSTVVKTANDYPSDDDIHTTIDISQPVSVRTQPQPFASSYGYDAQRSVIDADAVEAVEVSVSMQDVEKEAIRHALIHNRGRRKDAARELQISERTLYRKIKQYELDNI